jgi:FkbM family methyltransferase
MKLKAKIGMLKSRLIYDFKPFIQFRMKRFYSRFIHPGDLCFDIGAHTGNKSEAWLGMDAIVVAIEPQPSFAQLIQHKLGNKKNFNLLQLAVGEKSGQSQLQLSYLHPAISTISENWVQVMKDFDPSVKFEESVEVNIITLDALIEQFGLPKFCKIDVEGYEEQVLMGLSEAIPSLSFEFFPTTILRAVKCIEILEKLGNYSYNWSLIETFKYRNSKWVAADEMKKEIIKYKERKSGDIYAVLKKAGL